MKATNVLKTESETDSPQTDVNDKRVAGYGYYRVAAQKRPGAGSMRVLGLLRSLLLLAIPAAPHTVLAATDLIIDGVTTNVAGGSYSTVLVKNGGILNVSGSLQADQILAVTRGTLNVSTDVKCPNVSIDGTAFIGGNLTASNVTLVSGATRVLGASNLADVVTVQGLLAASGTWRVKSFIIETNATVQVNTIDENVPGSGTFFLYGDRVQIDRGGQIYAVGAGADPRGKGHDWYANSDGGGGFGTGGRGYWNSSGGNEGQGFGTAHAYEAFMGGAGGYNGGGAILIEAEKEFHLEGDIWANGQDSAYDSWGGGGGGSIVVRSAEVTINGKMSARGGDGGGRSGGGGGGRIKVFYGNDGLPSFLSLTDVRGGYAGGYLNTQPGQPGVVYRDSIPRLGPVDAPADNATVSNGRTAFRFTVNDLSGVLDDRPEAIAPVIELSQDGFRTVAYTFSQDTSLAGWSKAVYYSGDLVQYTPMVNLTNGVYEWRVTLRDQSVYSRYSIPRTVAVGVDLPASEFRTGIFMTPTISLAGELGSTWRIDYSLGVGAAYAWMPLATVLITNSPQLFLDFSGVGQPSRFYRCVLQP